MRNRFYFDELYEGIIAVTQGLASRIADWFDRWIISGLMVRGISGLADLGGRGLRLAQTGNLQSYAFILVMGVALVLFFVFRTRL
jgi:NADH-quinone oxidoreductase subunit L